MINYLFSHIDLEKVFTKKQSEYLKKDIKKNSIITFLVNDEEHVKKILTCFKKIDIIFKEYYILDKVDEEIINKSDIIYLSGGIPKEKMNKLKAFKDILKNYNGIIIGTSAGSMNQATQVTYLDEDKLISYEGLGLTNILIYPHFNINDESLVKEVSEVSKHQKIYCLPNESFIKIENDNIIIEGPYYILGE